MKLISLTALFIEGFIFSRAFRWNPRVLIVQVRKLLNMFFYPRRIVSQFLNEVIFELDVAARARGAGREGQDFRVRMSLWVACLRFILFLRLQSALLCFPTTYTHADFCHDKAIYIG